MTGMEQDQSRLLKTITSLLEEIEIPYMITGAWSVIYYGRPRASHDIDIVVELDQKDIQKVLDAVSRLASEFLIHADDIKEAVAKRRIFRKIR